MSSPFLCREFAEHLTLDVACDLPTSIRSVDQSQLDEWGLTFEEALAIASDNLDLHIPASVAPFRPGLYVVDNGDVFNTSLLHLRQRIDGFAVKGHLVAMIPNRGVLLVTGADDSTGLNAMAEIAEKVLTQPRTTIGIAFRLDLDWTPFLPTADHLAYKALHRLSSGLISHFYEQQRLFLDAIYDKEGDEIHVAEMMVASRGDVRYSIASWSEGVPMLLPRTDYVGLGSPDRHGNLHVYGLASLGANQGGRGRSADAAGNISGALPCGWLPEQRAASRPASTADPV